MEEETVVTTEVAAEGEAKELAITLAEEGEEQTPKADVTVAEGAGEVPMEEPEPPPRKKTAQERIDEITRARRDAEREAEYWRKQALKNAKEETPAQVVEVSTPVPARPKLDQFETVEQYEDALLGWHETKRTVETQAQATKKRAEEATRKFQDKAAKLRAEYDDFDETIEAPVFTPAMRLALLNADNGPSIAYYLGKEENRKVAEKIAELPAEMQLYELGKLETQLIIAQKTKKITAAPTPIKPVSTGMSGGEIDTDKMTDDEWYAWDKQQTRKKLEAKYRGG